MATLQMGDALIAEVLTKINIICGISSDGISQPTPSAINDSNTWLCAFQHRPEAWVVCDTILYLPQASGPAKQFAAQRLLVSFVLFVLIIYLCMMYPLSLLHSLNEFVV